MPYKSASQQRYFHYLESKGKMPKKTVDEFDQATDFHGLPEHVKKMYDGGMVEDENPDVEQGEASEFDSTGEPHTEHYKEDDEPMEYMAHGGRVKRMARGGMVHNSGFAKALRKASR